MHPVRHLPPWLAVREVATLLDWSQQPQSGLVQRMAANCLSSARPGLLLLWR